jgi:hypothetical protein
MAETYPVTSLDSDALDAARLLAEQRRPGILVSDETGRPYAVLGASKVVRSWCPAMCWTTRRWRRVIDEPVAD